MLNHKPPNQSFTGRQWFLAILAITLISITTAGSNAAVFSFLDSVQKSLASAPVRAGAPQAPPSDAIRPSTGDPSAFRADGAASRTERSAPPQWFAKRAFFVNEALQLSFSNDFLAGTALSFNGSNQYVTFGQATTTLGVQTFTLEAWAYRKSTGGKLMGTGTGGLTNVFPVISKGMGENDSPANLNMNYFMGISNAGILSGDFEDTINGGNHPVSGIATIAADQWHHIAATYDGQIWKLYIDGVLDKTLTLPSAFTPENSSIQHAALASSLQSSGNPTASTSGYFNGYIDEPRIWNVARTQAEIQANMYSELTSGTGLIGRWGLNEGSGSTASNSIAGRPNGTLINSPTWIGGFPDNVPPAAPSGVIATSALGAVNLSWTAPADPDIAGYNVYRGTTSGFTPGSPLNGALITVITYSDTSGTAGTPYYYVVKTVDTSGNLSPISSEVTGTPLADSTPPAAPTGLTATPGNTSVALSWTANSEGDLAGYNLYRTTISPVPLTGPINGGTLVTGTSYNDTGRTNGQIYYYVVTAVDTSTNQSGASNEANATPAVLPGALQFDGNNDYVTFGNAAGLGLQNFTVETWFKRTGAGVAVSTGSNGVTAVPLVTKGSPQADGSNVDENYVLGIRSSDGVLAADFEIFTACNGRPAGDNNPIVGVTPIVNNTWYHAAFTYDGTALRLYLNGNLENTLASTCLPRYDSIQHAGLGTYLTSTGTASGFFNGVLDEARIWNVARTQSDIANTINAEITSGTGLVARWGLNEGSGLTANSSVGTFPGTLTNGPVWVTPGAPFNIAPPPPPAAPTLLSATATAGLQVDLAWTDNSNNETSFKIERSPDGTEGWTQIDTTLANVTAYSNTGLNPGTFYCYRVRGSNGAGNSDYSNTSCATTPGVANNALNLGSDTAYAGFGDPAELDLAQFTIETWFRRTGAGTPNTTGTNGIPNAIPLVTHGAPEAEGSSVDANWVLVIDDATDVIAADFEDSATGANHPVLGVTPIADNTWHHAAATYDGTTWRLYLDGALETTLAVGATPRSDSTQRSGLGAMFQTDGTALGHFNGTLDEVRVWNYARTQSQIQGTINSAVAVGQTGLVARWGLDQTTGTAVPSSAGTVVPGTITGTGYSWVAGAPAIVNHAPQFVSGSPENLATNVTISPTLTATVTDPDLDNLTVQFYGRPKAAAAPGADFSIIALPDTQYYTGQLNGGTAAIFNSQTQWVVDNKTASNIAFVTQLGDCTENGNVTAEWQRADTAFQIIENPGTTGLTHGIPYGIAPGNHDQFPIGNPTGTAAYNTWFGEARFLGRSYYQGHYGTDNDNHYEFFSASGLDFLIVHLEWDPSANAAVLAWANGLLQANPNRRAIVVTHWMVNGGSNASFSAQGQAIYNALKDNSNLFLLLGGHVPSPAEGRRSDTYLGNTVNSLMSDYQGRTNGGNGWMRIMTFSPVSNTISVKTYSPWLNQFETDADSQFTLTYNMSSPAAPFELIGTDTVPNGGTASVNWNGRTVGTEYEWYVTINDTIATTTAPTRSFTTVAEANQPPVITEGASTAVTMSEDGSPTAFSKTLNATDANLGDTLTWSIAGAGAHGTATATGNGLSKVIGYTPAADYNGSDSFVVQVSDGNGGTDTITVNVTIDPVNDVPVCSNVPLTTPVNTAGEVAPSCTDADAGDSLTYSIVDQPTNGSASVLSGNLNYVPASNFSGPDAFTYRANDGTADSNTATVNVTVAAALCGTDPTLVGCWPMEEGSGSTLIDATAFGNDATTTGAPTWAVGRVGTYALDLNGSSQYANVPDDPSLDLTNSITIATWVKPEAFTGNPQDLIKKATNGATDGFELSLSSTGSAWPQKVFFRINQLTSGDTYRINSTSLFPIDGNTWMHVAATYNGATMRLYINGVEEANLATTVLIATNNLPLTIGAQDGATASRFFQGWMDDTRVYNRALSLAEIETLAGVTPPTFNISGNAGRAGATLNYTGGSVTANGGGNYSFGVSSGWSGTVTPFATGYTFAPASRTYSGVTADQTSQDYVATPVVFPPPSGLTCTVLQPKSLTAGTGEKPQSKVWNYNGAWYAIFPTSASGASTAGTWLWKLQGTTWTEMLKLSNRTDVKADAKSVGNVVHALLYAGTNTELVSAEYVAGTYQLWTSRPSASPLALGGSEIATIDIDSTGRMWLATENDGTGQIVTHFSDSPYSSWNGPITLATGVNADDISVIAKLPGRIGILWSNQNTRRFGFRVHNDTDAPNVWAADEVPASQSAQNVGLGMADDHLNVKVASDGTVYAAVKTSYDTAGYPKVALLVRRPAGTWDDLYTVDTAGTRGNIELDETLGVLTYLYTQSEGFNPIVYRQSGLGPISFGAQQTLRSGSFNDVSSTKQNYDNELAVIYGSSTEVGGQLCTSTTHTLTYTAGAGGSISGISPQTVNHGANGTQMTAVPNTGYRFVDWSDGVTTATRTDTNVTADISVTANFAPITYTVTPSAESGGSISPNTPQTVNHGATPSFTVTPDTGYSILSVTGCGGSLIANVFTTASVTANCTVTASFAPIAYTVTFDANGGTGTLAPQTRNYNDAANLTANSFTRTGYTFAGWGTNVGGPVAYADQASYPFTASVTLYAQWTIIPPVTVSGNIQRDNLPAATTPLGGVTVALGGDQTDSTTTDASGNYSFTGLAAGGSYTITPTLADYAFDPISRSYSNLSGNVTTGNFIGYAGTIPRLVKAVSQNVAPSAGSAVVPVTMVSQGNENTVSFSLTYDPAVLSAPSVAAGTACPSCPVTVNDLTPGVLSVIVAQPTAGTFAAGTAQIVRITFNTTPTAPQFTGSAIAFGDLPTARQVTSADNDPLTAAYANGFVTFAVGFEASVSNRPHGNNDGTISVSDYTQTGLFVVGLDQPHPLYNELQRADSAPRASRGDGRLTAADYVQAGRYAAGLDPVQPVGGAAFAGLFSPEEMTKRQDDLLSLLPRVLYAADVQTSPGQQVTVSVRVDANGDENGFGFTVSYDGTKLGNPLVLTGADLPAASPMSNTLTPGKVGVVTAAGIGETIPAGTREIARIRFDVLPTADPGTTLITFTGQPAVNEVSNAGAESLPMTFNAGTITILGPTAANASVGGIVMSADGMAVSNTRVTMTNSTGISRTVISNAFGFFRFDDVAVGETYVISVRAKEYVFVPRVLNVTEEVTNLSLVAEP